MEERRIFCAIVGAGMTGVTLADRILATHTLRRDEFVIFDKNTDFGGVWETNIYPGVACDIPSHAYVMKTYLNPSKQICSIRFVTYLSLRPPVNFWVF